MENENIETTTIKSVPELGSGLFYCPVCKSYPDFVHHTLNIDVWCNGKAVWIQGPFYTMETT